MFVAGPTGGTAVEKESAGTDAVTTELSPTTISALAIAAPVMRARRRAAALGRSEAGRGPARRRDATVAGVA
ncbi:hypothetical protein, partial [Frankia sp. CiP1_Cm_nod1]|uniref:hypothetical protein n=1 Tax=Frankia sp. CiP1_Cm_nod1 TaxID=2897160 RepID=UPI0020244693